jgi:hypothetical protein
VHYPVSDRLARRHPAAAQFLDRDKTVVFPNDALNCRNVVTMHHDEARWHPAQVLVLGLCQFDSLLTLGGGAFAENQQALREVEAIGDSLMRSLTSRNNAWRCAICVAVSVGNAGRPAIASAPPPVIVRSGAGPLW